MAKIDKAFNNAKLYTWRDDDEVLNFITPVEALEDFVGQFQGQGRSADTAAIIAKHAPVEVRAYNPMPVPNQDRDRWASYLLEHLHDLLEESYGDPDGNVESIDPDDHDLLRRFRGLIDHVLAHADIWQCECVGKREYSAAEIEAMLREHRPDWFEFEEGSRR